MLLSLIPRHPRRCEDAEKLKNIYSVSKTLIGLARNETNDELLFPRLDFFFPRPKGGQLFSQGRRPRLNRPSFGQGKKRSPTKEKEVHQRFQFPLQQPIIMS